MYYIEATQRIPYANIALEEYLLTSVPQEDAFILYLWQNEKTVVIGRNQCAWRECNVQKLNDDGGHLARRLSGGGAVFHDKGNLNFTFLYKKEQENIRRQTEIIANAVASFGLAPTVSGRNDITIDGRKFSGNAYFTKGARAYHHGTIMLDVDFSMLDQYLNVNEEKYRSKGISSVRSRVVNLRELAPSLTVEEMKRALIEATQEALGKDAQPIPEEWIDRDDLQKRTERFTDWGWIYGRPIPFNWEGEHRYSWGMLRIELQINRGLIRGCGIYTDAMRIDLFNAVQQALVGIPFDFSEAQKRIVAKMPENEHRADLLDLLKRAFE